MERLNWCRGGLVLLIALALMVGSGCSTVESRIKEKPAAYQALSAADRELVANHEIREGFSKDAVYIAWGRPDRVARWTDMGKRYEKWTWMTYYDRPTGYYYDPFHYGYWGYGPEWYPAYETIGYPWKVAIFREARVIAWKTNGL